MWSEDGTDHGISVRVKLGNDGLPIQGFENGRVCRLMLAWRYARICVSSFTGLVGSNANLVGHDFCASRGSMAITASYWPRGSRVHAIGLEQTGDDANGFSCNENGGLERQG